MHEEFAFWDYNEWKQHVAEVGFSVLEVNSTNSHLSRVYTNPWIVENRYRDMVSLFTRSAGDLIPLPYPPTTLIIVAEKR
jgi:hypothetical protein